MIYLRKIIKKLPYSLKLPLLHLVSLIPNNLKDSGEYKEYVKFLESSQEWNKEKIEEFQNLQLKLLIKHAYENVPYYQETYNEYGIKVADIQDISDLNKLPFTNKQIVKDNAEKFIARNFDIKKLNSMHTGGTTSSPMHFFNTKTTDNREIAFFNRIWTKYGYNRDLCLVLRGYDEDEQLYRYNPNRNFIVVNTKHLDDNKMEEIIKVIEKYRPSFIQAYPSIVYLLAKYINEYNLFDRVNQIKTVFCSSEKLYGFQREEIHKAFSAQVIDYYGHNERLVLMEYCPDCKMYHVIPEYGVAEFIESNGNCISKNGGIAEIVGTGFNNYAFPLIRYKTSDMATLPEETFEPKCGKPYISVQEIDGRSGDFLITKNRKRYSPTVLEFAMDYVENFKDLQLIQSSYDRLEVLIVPTEAYTNKEGNQFISELMKIIDDEIQINIKIVKKIDRPLNQKHRFIISNVK
ncbi:phenylacetate--CoA ligase family protein [Bacillus sp. RC51]|uniref:phenylacetate--CoA ligase family protein n=1 Tax=Bacillus sp. RC51 TaxID=3156288 RepID=UPI0038500909